MPPASHIKTPPASATLLVVTPVNGVVRCRHMAEDRQLGVSATGHSVVLLVKDRNNAGLETSQSVSSHVDRQNHGPFLYISTIRSQHLTHQPFPPVKLSRIEQYRERISASRILVRLRPPSPSIHAKQRGPVPGMQLSLPCMLYPQHRNTKRETGSSPSKMY